MMRCWPHGRWPHGRWPHGGLPPCFRVFLRDELITLSYYFYLDRVEWPLIQ